MASNEERVLSHYLWSLDNALSGLIGLCNDKPEIAERITKQVQDKLNVWNKHVIHIDLKDTQEETKDTEEKEEEEAITTPMIPSKPTMTAWGDCSDEDDDDDADDFLLNDATGLCKPNILQIKSDIHTNASQHKDEIIETNDETKALDILNTEIEPLFIDDTLRNETDDAHNTQMGTGLTWAQRTKKNENTNNGQKQSQKQKTKTKTKTNANIDVKVKAKTIGRNTTGWSKVYRSKKNKIASRYSGKINHGNKSSQQRLIEAEDKKKQQILFRQQKHAEIFHRVHQNILSKEEQDEKTVFLKKKASKERLKKAQEKRIKTDILRREKAIKDDVRREEIRIFQEWQQQEKKSAIVEKQVAAEIHKLKIAQKMTQKVSFCEERVKIMKMKMKRVRGAGAGAGRIHSKKKKKKKTKKKKEIKNKSNKEKEKNVSDEWVIAGARVLSNDNCAYYDVDVIRGGMGKYLCQPGVGRVSVSLRKCIHCTDLEGMVSILLRAQVDSNIDNDVLFVIHRLMQFEPSIKMMQCLVGCSVNRIGALLLSVSYLDKLLQFFKHCVYQYIFKRNSMYACVNEQVCVILTRILRINHEDAQFIQDCNSQILFKFYNCAIFNVICSVFKSLNNENISQYLEYLDGFLSILIAISGLLLHAHELKLNNNICGVLVSNNVSFGAILNFMSTLVFIDNDISVISRQSVALLNGCISYLNAICKMNIKMVQSHILEYEMEIYHIFIILLQYTSSNFMNECRDRMNANSNKKHECVECAKCREIENIRELCKGLLQFIAFCATNNVQIQDMFRFISCNNNKPTLIKQLTQFPFFFFINNDGKLSLYPTLIAITYENSQNLEILKQTFNTKLIKIWLKKNIAKIYLHNKHKCDYDDQQMNKIFTQKVPPQIWSKCLQIY